QREGEWHTFVAAIGHSRDFEARAGVSEADNEGLGLSLGTSYRLADSWRLGFSLGLQDQRLETPTGSRYKLDAYLLSTFLQYQRSRFWADAGLTYASWTTAISNAASHWASANGWRRARPRGPSVAPVCAWVMRWVDRAPGA